MQRQGRCLILGGCGFIGSNLAEKLLALDYQVRVFDMPTATRIHLVPVESDIEFFVGSFLNDEDVDAAVQGVDFVFHLVGTTLPANSNRRPIFDVESNVLATIRLLQSSVRHRVKRIIFSSSGGTVYGEPQTIPILEDHRTDPICSYGITKLTCEKYLQLFHHLYGLDYTILRIGNPYGKYQKVTAEQGIVGVFLNHINQGKMITIWGDGAVTRDYIYVGDVANAFVAALKQDSPYRIFNVGTGVGISVRDLLRKMERITGIQPHLEYASGRPIDVSINVLDSTRAQKYMNWRAEIDCDEGLRRTWAWICESKANIATG
jgi:UDP-glucose 4-epimerase